jgi:hypothetical protein
MSRTRYIDSIASHRTETRLEHAHEWDGVERALRSRGAVAWDEDTKVVEPSTAVELGEDGGDEEWLRCGGVDGRAGLENDDAGDGLLGGGDGTRSGRTPADDDSVTGVPEVEDLEWDRGLAALALNELLAVVEGGRTESDRAGATAVDELDDGVCRSWRQSRMSNDFPMSKLLTGVIDEVLVQGSQSQGLVEFFVD